MGHHAPSAPEPGDETIRWLFALWDGRYLILASVIVFLAFGGFYVWRLAPQYRAEAMIQIQPKRNHNTDSFPKLDGLLTEPGDAEAEIEIITSSHVLGRVVQTLDLDLSVRPKTLPIIGDALLRRRADRPVLDLGQFEVPETFRGESFTLTALPSGEFMVMSPEGRNQAKGRIGESMTVPCGPGELRLKVLKMQAKPGQVFTVVRGGLQATISALRGRLDVSERTKMTNVLGLGYTDSTPEQSAKVLDEVIRQYIAHYQEKRATEAARLMKSLQARTPELLRELEAAEGQLNTSRSQSAAVNLPREAELLLQQSTAVKVQISTLQQRRDDLLRTYTEKADNVITIDRQIARLMAEEDALERRMRALPLAQQDEVRHSRDVQVNTALYSALVSNIQQLQIYSASNPGRITVVDQASPSHQPVAPRKSRLMVLFLFIGCVAGAAAALLRNMLRRGLEDYRIIESKLGIPVLETIPHSEAQARQDRAARRRRKGMHLLALGAPDDPAMEGLRGLRTMLHLSMKGQASRVVMITGPSPSIGKSFISSNLAALLAQTDARVLLIDADLRRGRQHLTFGLSERGPGFSDILSGARNWQSVLNPILSDPELETTSQFRFNLITTGAIPPNPSELLLSHRLADFLHEVAGAYDYVIVDAPPLLSATDATIIASKVDTVFLAAKYGRHPIEELRACQKRLEKHGIPLTGCIFNDIESVGLDVFHPYRYAYQYRYKAAL